MPPLDFSDLQDDSGMDLDSEIPLTYSRDFHSGSQLETSLSFASTEFNRQSGKRMRTNRGNLPFDIWDNAASNALPPVLPAANQPQVNCSTLSRRNLSSVRANFSYKAILLGHPIAAVPFSYSGII
jgi:hypothetical protein